MKKLIMIFVVCFGLSTLVGCGGVMSPVSGALFTGLKAPFWAGAGGGCGPETGTSECMGILGLVAIGDASIKTAAENGGITKIHAVDYEAFSVLGVFSKFTTIVYGEK